MYQEMKIEDIKNIIETEDPKCFVEVKLNREWHAVPITKKVLLEKFKKHRTAETLGVHHNLRNELYIG